MDLYQMKQHIIEYLYLSNFCSLFLARPRSYFGLIFLFIVLLLPKCKIWVLRSLDMQQHRKVLLDHSFKKSDNYSIKHFVHFTTFIIQWEEWYMIIKYNEFFSLIFSTLYWPSSGLTAGTFMTFRPSCYNIVANLFAVFILHPGKEQINVEKLWQEFLVSVCVVVLH